jgi:phosphopantothenoylcysteine decarboxylase/phosphopantothenate--cysteine ligase
MGFAVAEVARDAGARVTLVSGPVALADPAGMAVKHVRSAEQMRSAVLEALPAQDALILAAAVSDYRAKTVAAQKIKREGKANLVLELEANADIAAEVGERRRQGQVLVVFAAESQDLLHNAGKKLDKKNADIVAANDITQPGSGFASGQNRITLLRRSAPDRPIALPLMDKREAARHILAEVAALLAG